MRNELVQTAIDKMLEMFRTQDFPADLGMQLIRRRKGDNPIPSDSWSAGNRWIMLASGTSMAMGFGQWHKYCRTVKPGSKAFYIFAPMTRPLKTEDDEGPESTRTLLTGFRLIPVFRMEDTTGKPLPVTMDLTPAVLPPLFDVAEKLGVTRVRYAPFDGRVLGRYNPGSREITLSEQSALTFYHEVIHHMDAKVEPIRPGRLCEAELIAELGGSVLCAIQGITGYENSTYRYLRAYAEGKDPEAVLRSVMSVAARVELLVGLVLDAAVSDAMKPPTAVPA